VAAVGFSLLSFVATSTSAQAASIALSTLLVPGSSFTVGDKVFSDFTFSSIATGGASAVDPALVSLIGSEVDPLTVRLDYQTAAFFASAGQTQDTVLSFRVTSTRDLITDNHLALVSAAVGPGGVVAIAEEVTALNPDVLGQKLVFINDSGASLQDDAVFAPQTSVRVTTNIGVVGPGFISDFQQEFTQVAVPEPTSLLLMGLGLSMGVGTRVMRRMRRGRSPKEL
jgi:hypothetical protein